MKLLFAIWLGKLIFFLTRFLKTGGGSAGPGYYGLKIDPDLNRKLAKQIPQNIVITGTNGKTTTARLLDHFIKHQKLKVIRNSTGSNLARGVASTLIAHSDLLGHIQADLGIWELDEAAFNNVVFDLKPEIIVFLNAFRDQLDRYGEVDSVVKKWQATLEKINWECAIVLNGGDNHTWSLRAESGKGKGERKGKSFNLPVSAFRFYEFRVKDHQMTQEKIVDQTDQHQDDFVAEITKNNGLSGLEFELNFPDKQSLPSAEAEGEKLKINLPIPGMYHVYDFLAAFSAYYLLNLPLGQINENLQSYLPAFGRVEKIKLENNEAYIFLIKNPTGATEVFQTIAPELKNGDRLLIALNDNFADGKDVSWIWDAAFEKLADACHPERSEGYKKTKKLYSSASPQNDTLVMCSGSRAQDLALRLKYAGVDQIHLKVENSLEKALLEAQDGLNGRLFILPTYTALLELQQILAKQGLKQHYWKED